MKKIVACLFVVVLSFAMLSGCSSKPSLDGTWKLTKSTMGDTEISVEKLKEFGVKVMELKLADGKITIDVGGETVEGTYTLDGKKITIKETGVENENLMEGTIDGKELKINDGSMTLYFEKE